MLHLKFLTSNGQTATRPDEFARTDYVQITSREGDSPTIMVTKISHFLLINILLFQIKLDVLGIDKCLPKCYLTKKSSKSATSAG